MAAAYIHWKECQHYSIEVPERWYEHKPEKVTKNEEAMGESHGEHVRFPLGAPIFSAEHFLVARNIYF